MSNDHLSQQLTSTQLDLWLYSQSNKLSSRVPGCAVNLSRNETFKCITYSVEQMIMNRCLGKQHQQRPWSTSRCTTANNDRLSTTLDRHRSLDSTRLDSIIQTEITILSHRMNWCDVNIYKFSTSLICPSFQPSLSCDFITTRPPVSLKNIFVFININKNVIIVVVVVKSEAYLTFAGRLRGYYTVITLWECVRIPPKFCWSVWTLWALSSGVRERERERAELIELNKIHRRSTSNN